MQQCKYYACVLRQLRGNVDRAARSTLADPSAPPRLRPPSRSQAGVNRNTSWSGCSATTNATNRTSNWPGFLSEREAVGPVRSGRVLTRLLAKLFKPIESLGCHIRARTTGFGQSSVDGSGALGTEPSLCLWRLTPPKWPSEGARTALARQRRHSKSPGCGFGPFFSLCFLITRRLTAVA